MIGYTAAIDDVLLVYCTTKWLDNILNASREPGQKLRYPRRVVKDIWHLRIDRAPEQELWTERAELLGIPRAINIRRKPSDEKGRLSPEGGKTLINISASPKLFTDPSLWTVNFPVAVKRPPVRGPAMGEYRLIESLSGEHEMRRRRDQKRCRALYDSGVAFLASGGRSESVAVEKDDKHTIVWVEFSRAVGITVYKYLEFGLAFCVAGHHQIEEKECPPHKEFLFRKPERALRSP
ncbi:hypothetical protein BD410DRAFT_806683 [Rickenella mellea]|uniref:Uncharacterized protein n=1 Tax=Rickenella mellea TaxID=50990 RepID=A0A4Y7PTS7_9AGAM|nr:hypothetical protein BD410DRAFT_806683 [Rickenella mellea]